MKVKPFDEKKAFNKAKERALYLLEYRDHSKKELIDKVKRTNSEESAIQAVEYLEELGLVNDENFAKKYAHDLVYLKRLSGKRLEYELKKKGLDDFVIEEAISEIDVDYVKTIIEIINRKYPRAVLDEKQKNRAVNVCRRLGYKWDDIKAAINILAEGVDNECL